MALRGVVEVVVHFESFRNVDLFHQGMYHLKTRIYQDAGDQIISAIPYAHSGEQHQRSMSSASSSSSGQSVKLKDQRADQHNVLDPHITDDQYTFSTRTFIIRYCEEEVELGDIGQFRIEVDVARILQERPGSPGLTQTLLSAPLYLEVDLMYADFNQNSKPGGNAADMPPNSQAATPGGSGEGGGRDGCDRGKDADKTEFKSVSYQVYRLNNVTTGVHEYIPVVFDEYHFATAVLLVHSVLLDFRFRIRPSLVSAPYQTRHKLAARRPPTPSPLPPTSSSLASGAGGGMMVGGAQGGGAGGGPIAFSEFLYANRMSVEDGDSLAQVADRSHRDYLGLLLQAYYNLRSKFTTYVNRCLTQAQRNEFGDSLAIPSLELPCSSPTSAPLRPKKPASHPATTRNNTTSASSADDTSADDIGDDSPPSAPPNLSPPSAFGMNMPDWERDLQCVPSLSERLDEVTSQSAATLMAQDFHVLATQLFELWHKFLNLVPFVTKELQMLLRVQWERQVLERWSEAIFRDLIPLDDLAVSPSYETNLATWEIHQKEADRVRSSLLQPSAVFGEEERSLVEDIAGSTAETQPTIFEQRYVTLKDAGARGLVGDWQSKEALTMLSNRQAPITSNRANSKKVPPIPRVIPSQPKPYKGTHLVVLVHGFQGNSWDMRLMRNHLALLFPECVYLCSSCNEDKTEGDIDEMGQRLAEEVRHAIADWCPGSALGRLSFIAHSLGGLIVRAAVQHLREYWGHFGLYLTLSTPHLGYMNNANKLVDAGMWFLKKWKKSQCLQQLTMTDAKEPRDTFIYKLSNYSGLDQFQHIVLMSSWQDQYAPYDSARIEISKNPGTDVKLTTSYAEMARNFFKTVDVTRVTRFDVNFHIPEKSLDAYIGRAAHIQFLECQPLMRMFIHTYAHLFR
ncbi:unnamed protein product [Vitrella brassicaformis CCMP3155]|uniref:DUF676 domain-containing protein n=2 Tax=Vitrella brassicaformis TaxID=1169539 RepID=A0A0G4EB95_VITBC|nr:unnamed protein product [Vitrella brassicaformis CCMP3155]|eukprot:CEL92530.1 unnamed protein product [Vitrella brassicaformis CCMP3155]